MPKLINLAILHEQQESLPPRPSDSHKGDFGHVLVLAGNEGMSGAAILATEAAARTGAGLASCATTPNTVMPLLMRCPTVMVKAVASGLEVQPLLARATVLAVGPGLGQDGWAELMLQQAFNSELPLVLDADGLNLLATKSWQRNFAGRAVVLTPHVGEAARLLGISVDEIQSDRQAAALKLAAKYQAVVVLKGAGSLIASFTGELAQCTAGNPGMSSGGMGDVLTGIVAGLLAQGLSPWQAACLGVCVHAQAADQVAAQNGMRGMLASDLFAPLQSLVN